MNLSRRILAGISVIATLTMVGVQPALAAPQPQQSSLATTGVSTPDSWWCRITRTCDNA